MPKRHVPRAQSAEWSMVGISEASASATEFIYMLSCYQIYIAYTQIYTYIYICVYMLPNLYSIHPNIYIHICIYVLYILPKNPIMF